MDVASLKKLPIDIDLLQVKENELPRVGRITDMQIFDQNGNFHQNGLFSTTLFGNVGSEYRNRTFAYIDLGVTIIHPLIYYAIINLKSFYKQIMDGTAMAVFNPKTKEFEKSNLAEAKTGYNFFFSYITELKFERNESDKRNFLIQLFEKSIRENTYSMKYLLVLPAGLRDYIVDPSGKPQEDEVNTYYRKILAQSNLIDPSSVKKAPEVYDNLASGIQKMVLELFEYLKSLLEGKHKLILGKWLTRKIFNSTRNVLSNAVEKIDRIDDHNHLGYNDVLAGLHQFIRATMPKSTYEIRTKYIKQIFVENTTSAQLTNAITLQKEEVLNAHIQKDYDLWTSSDGLEKVVASLSNMDMRDIPVVLNKGKHYLGLVYQDAKVFKFFQDIRELPEGLSKDNVRPVSISEFMYMSVYHMSGKYPGLLTRYPISGFGSIYPCFIKLGTTMHSLRLEELDENWQPSGNIAHSFPKAGEEYYNTTSVHPSHIAALDADFDGDTVSLTALLTDEAVSEVTDYLGKKEYYFSDSGALTFSSDTDILSAVLAYMTG